MPYSHAVVPQSCHCRVLVVPNLCHTWNAVVSRWCGSHAVEPQSFLCRIVVLTNLCHNLNAVVSSSCHTVTEVNLYSCHNLTVIILLYVVSKRYCFYHAVNKPPPGLLEFKEMSRKFPWNIIILLGSGFALADACKVKTIAWVPHTWIR